MTMAQRVTRAFADLPHGQLHYRHAGAGDVLLLLHGSPGSSRQLVRLIEAFAGTKQVIAPDTPGNGDSEPLPREAPEIADLARAMLAFLDSQGIGQTHVYGTHTGAVIAAELAILAPDRVLSVMLDGVSDLSDEELTDFLAHYAAPFEADLDGAYLTRLFQFCRDQFLFFPWFRRTKDARRDGGVPTPDDLAALVLETMKARTSYHRNYHAAFRWPARARLPLVPCPVLMLASLADPLHDTTQALAAFAPDHRFQSLPRYDAPNFAATQRSMMLQHMGQKD
jgi:pimeloyl-ACP methyl ester carboxylesterase